MSQGYQWDIKDVSLDNDTDKSDKLEYEETKLIIWIIQAVFPPFLLFIGIPGNLVTLSVLLRQQATYVSVFLRSILVFNILALLSLAVPEMIITATGQNPRLSSTSVCRLFQVTELTTAGMSNWLSVLISSSRIIYMINPWRARKLLTHTNSVLIVSVGVILLVLVEMLVIENMVSMEQVEGGGGALKDCDLVHRGSKWEPFFSIIPYTFLPAVILIVVNTLLFVFYEKTKFKEGADKDSLSFMEKKRMGYLVLMGDAHFVLTLGPHILYHPIAPHVWNQNIPKEHAFYALGHLTVELWMYTNFATNYFVYVCLGKRFRIELRRTMRTWSGQSRRKASSDFEADGSDVSHHSGSAQQEHFAPKETFSGLEQQSISPLHQVSFRTLDIITPYSASLAVSRATVAQSVAMGTETGTQMSVPLNQFKKSKSGSQWEAESTLS